MQAGEETVGVVLSEKPLTGYTTEKKVDSVEFVDLVKDRDTERKESEEVVRKWWRERELEGGFRDMWPKAAKALFRYGWREIED